MPLKTKTIKTIELDFVLPVFNPEDKWHIKVIESFNQIIRLNPIITFNFILINDGSTTNIQSDINIIKKSFTNFTYISLKENHGKGYALRKALISGNGEYSLFTDVDFPYRIENVSNIIAELLQKTTDIVIAKRSDKYYIQTNFQRKYISKFTKLLFKILFNLNHTDTQAGLKGFNKCGKNIFLRTKSNRFLFDLEFIKKASNANLKISSYPVTLRDGVQIPSLNIFTLIREIPDLFRIIFSE